MVRRLRCFGGSVVRWLGGFGGLVLCWFGGAGGLEVEEVKVVRCLCPSVV